MQYSLKNEEIAAFNESGGVSFPKYTSQLMNWANQNAQGTRPAVVGQMSELFPAFLESGETATIENWRQWYESLYPDALETAAEKVYAQIQNLKAAIALIDRDMVSQWVEELVIRKTFNGLYAQKAILASLAERTGETYRMATPEEESKGVDGYVGDTAYSVKPDSYRSMARLSERIDVRMIYYAKTKTGLKIDAETPEESEGLE